MDLRQVFSPLRIADQIERLAFEVAQRSRTPVRERLGQAAQEMNGEEARGYVRARAAWVMHREADTALARIAQNQPLPSWARQELVSRSTEQVIPLVLSDLDMERDQAAEHRRAA